MSCAAGSYAPLHELLLTPTPPLPPPSARKRLPLPPPPPPPPLAACACSAGVEAEVVVLDAEGHFEGDATGIEVVFFSMSVTKSPAAM